MVAHLDGLVDVVGDEDDRLADLLLEAQELVLQPLAVDRVDRSERLVHQHQRRVDRQRPCHADALALAARELGGKAVARLVRVEADQLEQLVDARADPGLVPAQQARDGGDVVGHAQVREEADLLDGVADVAPQLGRLALFDAATVEQDVAVGDVDHAVDHPHGGRLATAGGTDQHADLAGRQLERQAVDSGLVLAGIALGRLPEFEGGGWRA